ncbi:MAG: 2-amino-4-hydroxy-6-hydroxymethyldihydropteridine diphosphokinase [Chloroflexi bacterium]|nr:MAG: 2-amino-4-hydroxy-6-hydroxymethyldihydropteridine diphosphokinase [Chloroflexota bacterium]HDN79443.1 2-amino-4-hydroxy-6-hydroxymethyldihydropteridine diphosphokinase [Chloroflexota bacterium]
MALVYLGLGSNLGEREANLREALSRLRGKVELKRVSSIYETEPVGYKEQPWFLNLVCSGLTELSPRSLLQFIKKIEQEMGRVPSVRWGPRIIDIDILFYGDLIYSDDELTIPHPRIQERRFVLVPLAEIAPDLVHPVLGIKVRELLAEVEDKARVLKWREMEEADVRSNRVEAFRCRP